MPGFLGGAERLAVDPQTLVDESVADKAEGQCPDQANSEWQHADANDDDLQ